MVTLRFSFALLLICLSSTLFAQDLPRWKFAEGDRLRYEVKQQTDLKVTAGSAGETASFASQTLDIVWHVDKVDEAGTMTGTQRIERIRLLIRQPAGQEINYDSASEDPPEALAAMLSPLYEVLLNTEVPITVTSAGLVTSCQVPEEMTKRIKNMPATKVMREYSASTGVKMLAEQIALPLPTAEGPGRRKVDTALGVLGHLKGDLTWAPGDSADSKSVLKPALKITLEDSDEIEEVSGFAQPTPLESTSIKSQQVAGKADFDAEAGRLTSLELDITLTMTGKLFGNKVSNEVYQEIRVTRKQ